MGKKICRPLAWLWGNFECIISVAMFAIALLILTYQIVLRQIFGSPNFWAEEVSCYLFIGMSYIGASAAVMHGRHIKIESAPELFPKRIRPYIYILGSLVWFGLSFYVAINCLQYVQTIYISGRNSPAVHIMMWIPYSAMMIGFICMSIRIIQYELIPNILSAIRKDKYHGRGPSGGEENREMEVGLG